MYIGVDLLWVRPGICGGTESFIRNLLNGLAKYDTENHYILFVAQDNADTFQHYEKCSHMHLERCPVNCARQPKRILWENLHLDTYAKKAGVDVMFIPVYSKPRTRGSIPYAAVIHDLQALHYPQYFSKARRMFLHYAWDYTCRSARKVVTISDYCKEDLIRHYPKVREKVTTIYNPIITGGESGDFSALADKYGIRTDEYFYCVSSLLPHKNIETVLKVLSVWAGNEKLVLSGVGQNSGEMNTILQKYGIENRVVLTGFVSDAERDSLYENCRLFLFPSVFEGFGMPPIEAMRKGKRVVMTRESCLEEVTQGKAVYVQDPYSVVDWVKQMNYALTQPETMEEFPEYSLENITRQYIALWKACTEG